LIRRSCSYWNGLLVGALCGALSSSGRPHTRESRRVASGFCGCRTWTSRSAGRQPHAGVRPSSYSARQTVASTPPKFRAQPARRRPTGTTPLTAQQWRRGARRRGLLSCAGACVSGGRPKFDPRFGRTRLRPVGAEHMTLPTSCRTRQ
jgi:hypothetical protein